MAIQLKRAIGGARAALFPRPAIRVAVAPSAPSSQKRGTAVKKPGPGCGVPEKDESPQFEARNHSKQFLEKAARLAGKKSSKRSSRKRGWICAVDAEGFHSIYEKGEVAEA